MKLPALAPIEPVFVKELASLAGVSEETVLRRMHLWERDPSHPLAIPYLKRLGRPYRTTREVAEKILGVEVAA